MPSKYVDINDYVSHLQPWMQVIFCDVSMLILTFPEVTETFRYNSPFYDCAGKMMLYLSPIEKTRFVLGFCNGNLMPDEGGIVTNEKGQTQIKHWEFKQGEAFNEELLAQYIQEAIYLNQQLLKPKNVTGKTRKHK